MLPQQLREDACQSDCLGCDLLRRGLFEQAAAHAAVQIRPIPAKWSMAFSTSPDEETSMGHTNRHGAERPEQTFKGCGIFRQTARAR